MNWYREHSAMPKRVDAAPQSDVDFFKFALV
jgi:hypothetical protein